MSSDDSAGVSRLLWMDRTRGLAVLAVVVMHAELELVSATGQTWPWLTGVNQALGPVRMPFLVALSGALLPRALLKSARLYVVGKLRTLAWPYLVWGVADVAYWLVRVVRDGGEVDWSTFTDLLHDPHTYLWFLAYLFCFYVLALPTPAPLRTLAAPTCVGVGAALPGDAATFVSLFGWFLIGDVVARRLAHQLRAHPVPRGDVLGAMGRQSVVFYASHLMVIIAVSEVLAMIDVRDPVVVFTVLCLTPLGVGLLLVRGRGIPAVALLFAYPAGATTRAASTNPYSGPRSRSGPRRTTTVLLPGSTSST